MVDAVHDRGVAGATAQVRRWPRRSQRCFDLIVRRLGIRFQQFCDLDHHAELADATLRHLFFDPGFLNGVECAVGRQVALLCPARGQALDRRHFLTRDGGDRLVYSSETGRICPHCGRKVSVCECRGRGARARIEAREAALAEKSFDGIVRVGRSTKGRGGKVVTTVTGVPGGEEALRQLAAELKRSCGTGGAVKDGVIEIQGEHRDTLVRELERRGFKTKRVG